MAKKIINAKASPELKEAVRQVAFSERLSSSAFIVKCLESHPKVAKLLKSSVSKK